MEKIPQQEEQQTHSNGTPEPGKGPGRWAVLKKALLAKASPLIAHAKEHPETAVLGQFLYDLGFWGEYTARSILHTLASWLRGGIALLVWTLGKIGRFCKSALASACSELAAPVVRLVSGVQSIAQRAKERYKEGGVIHGFKGGMEYLFSGILRYSPLLVRAGAYVLPVIALGVFVYTVQTVLDYNYALAVEVNGSVVGYVQTEQVFDSAKSELEQRIQYVSSDERKWTIEPAYRIAVGETVMDENQMADRILEVSSADISEATALYVNDELVAVTTDGNTLRQSINDMIAPYQDPDNPNLKVEFTKEVRTEDGLYMTESIVPLEQILQKLHGEEQGAVTYTVQTGDTPWVVAGTFGISVDELKAMNPDKNLDTNFFPGDTLLISQAMPYLQVKRTVTEARTESIPFKSVEEKDSELSFGTQKVAQEGVDGIVEITEEKVYYGDSQTPSSVVEIDRQILQEAQDKIIKIGTKAANGDLVETGSGSLLWPVPGYKYVSRWMSSYHKGADICAAYGTPVLAADSGQVVTAGWHRDYGNYVVINHGNGMRTLYAHNSSLNVVAGQSVSQGQVIAYVGSTGDSSGNHCHFEIYKNGSLVSARNYFPNK